MGTVKGKIDILINEESTQVCLDYTPRDYGENWTVQKVLDLLARSGITHGVNRDHIQNALTLFEQKKKAQSGMVAQGASPSFPESHFTFAPKELNGELKKILKLVVVKAGPPPFKEKVSPEVKGAGYFAAGEKVGKLIFTGEMKPGIDVYGKKIAPGPGREDSFLLGKGLEKSPEGELTARVTGIVRQGENWLDLIPFEGHSWGLSVNADQSCIFLDFKPGKKIFGLPSPGEILKDARELINRDDTFVTEACIRDFLQETVNSRKPGRLGLTAARDAVIEIRTDASLTEASLYLRKGQGGGIPLSLKEVSRRVNESGLKGVDIEKIGQEIMGFYKSLSLEQEFPLCQGKKPERGKDRSINFLVHFMDDSYRELLLDKVELDPSLVSFYPSHRDLPLDKIQRLANVEKDQKIFALSNDGKGKSGVDVYGKEIPGLSGNDPILNLYENIEYRNGGGTALISGLLEVWWDKDANILQGRIREHTNAPVSVTLSANKMKASVSIGLPVGTGFPADRKLLEAALKSAGVVEGFLEEKIDEAAEASGLGEVVTEMVVAEGKFPLDESQELKLVHDIDFRDKSRNSVSIKAGEDVGYLVSSGEREGFTVTGEAVESQADEKALEIGENIEQIETDEQDVVKLTAGKSGRLIFTGSRLFIQDTVLITGDFSPHMGQLNFPGDVQVKGSVLSRAIINGGENISVNGVIQAALVSAGKSVFIDKGIKGSGKAVIRGNLLSFDYAEEAHLMAAEEIRCRKAMMRCQVRCNGRINSNGGNLKIVGGEVKVRDGLTAESVGNERGIVTAISFGQDFLVEDRITQLLRDTEKIQDQILRIDMIIEKARGRPDKQDLMMTARDKKVSMLKAIEKKNVKVFLLREKLEEHFSSSIKISGDLHEGTQFFSHGRSLSITEKKQSIEIYFDQKSGKILERPLK
jgi:uncharacterized protein